MRLKIVLSAVAIAAVAVGATYWYQSRQAPRPVPAGPPMAGGFAMPVEAEPVTVAVAQRRIQAVGTLRSFETVMLRPEVPGRVNAINFQEGQKVRKGQVLVQLDSTMERAELNQAQASLALARANYERAEELSKKGAGTQRALDEARAKLRSDEAALQLAQARLEKYSLIAPFDGVAGLRRMSMGDYMPSGGEMVNIEQIDPLKVDFRVPEIFLASVRVGQKIAIFADAFPERSFEGEVTAIDPLIDAAGRSIVLRARLPNPEDLLRPGLFVRVALTLAQRYDAIFVPEQALVPQGDQHFVFRVMPGLEGKPATVQFVRVRLGERAAGKAEVLEGLKRDDMVVTAGVLKIRDGAPVNVVPAGASAQGEGQPSSATQPGGKQ